MSYSQNRKKIRDSKRKEKIDHNKNLAYEELKSIAKKDFETTFIGILSIIEQEFGDELWRENSCEEEDMTEEEKVWYERFLSLRDELLDHGNKQMKSFLKDLTRFDISYRRRMYNLQRKDNE